MSSHKLLFQSINSHLNIYIYICCFSLLGALMSSSNIDPNSSSINNGTLALRSSAYSCPNSTQLTTMSTIDRPNSNLSNVYQTIDADRFVTYLFVEFFFSISMFDVHYSDKHRQSYTRYLCSLSSNSRTCIYVNRKLLVVHPEWIGLIFISLSRVATWLCIPVDW
jgi:hypothetical protein